MMTATEKNMPAASDRGQGEPAAFAIEAESIRVTYPARRRQPARLAVRGVTLRMVRGERAALLGPNGSGKSTLFRVLCGRLTPDIGHVRLLNRDLDSVDSDSIGPVRGALGVVFQDDSLDPCFSVRDNLLQHARFYGVDGQRALGRIDELLEQAGLADRRDALIRTLSQGLARRVDLCRALVHEPEILLLDEPTVGLDPGARRRFLDLLDQLHAERNLTVLLSTHLTDEADRQDRVILMHEGEIVADGSPAELRHELGDRILTVLAAAPAERASSGSPATAPAPHPKEDPEQDQAPDQAPDQAGTTPPWSPDPGERTSWHSRRGLWIRPVDGLSAAEIAQLTRPLIESGAAFTIAPATLEDVFLQRTGRALGEDAGSPSGPSLRPADRTGRSDPSVAPVAPETGVDSP